MLANNLTKRGEFSFLFYVMTMKMKSFFQRIAAWIKWGGGSVAGGRDELAIEAAIDSTVGESEL